MYCGRGSRILKSMHVQNTVIMVLKCTGTLHVCIHTYTHTYINVQDESEDVREWAAEEGHRGAQEGANRERRDRLRRLVFACRQIVVLKWIIFTLLNEVMCVFLYDYEILHYIYIYIYIYYVCIHM